MSRNWEWERWRKLYLVEPLEQQAWPWQTRGLRDLLIRLADDDGRLGSVDDVLVALRGDEELRESLGALVDDTFLVEEGGTVYVKNLPEAQGGPARDEEAADPQTDPSHRRRVGARERARRSREKRRAHAGRDGVRTQGVTEGAPAAHAGRDGVRTDGVTERDAPRAVSGSFDLKSSNPSQIYKPDEGDQSAREGVTPCAPDAHAPRDSVTRDGLDGKRSKRRPVGSLASLSDALEVPIRERSRLLLDQPHLAQWCQAHEWPEVSAFHARLRASLGLPELDLAAWAHDSTTRAIVQLLAMFSAEQLEEVIRRAPDDAYARDLRDVGGFSVRVVRQLLGPPKPAKGGRQPDVGPRYEFAVEEVG